MRSLPRRCRLRKSCLTARSGVKAPTINKTSKKYTGWVSKRVSSEILHVIDHFFGNLILDKNVCNFWIFCRQFENPGLLKNPRCYFLLKIRWVEKQNAWINYLYLILKIIIIKKNFERIEIIEMIFSKINLRIFWICCIFCWNNFIRNLKLLNKTLK